MKLPFPKGIHVNSRRRQATEGASNGEQPQRAWTALAGVIVRPRWGRGVVHHAPVGFTHGYSCFPLAGNRRFAFPKGMDMNSRRRQATEGASNGEQPQRACAASAVVIVRPRWGRAIIHHALPVGFTHGYSCFPLAGNVGWPFPKGIHVNSRRRQPTEDAPNGERPQRGRTSSALVIIRPRWGREVIDYPQSARFARGYSRFSPAGNATDVSE
jgi:hypothetical protein